MDSLALFLSASPTFKYGMKHWHLSWSISIYFSSVLIKFRPGNAFHVDRELFSFLLSVFLNLFQRIFSFSGTGHFHWLRLSTVFQAYVLWIVCDSDWPKLIAATINAALNSGSYSTCCPFELCVDCFQIETWRTKVP